MTDSNLVSQKLKRCKKKLEKQEAAWLQKLQYHQNVRLIVGLLFFASLVLSTAYQDIVFLMMLSGVLLIGFVFLIVRTKKIAQFHLKISKLLIFKDRQLHRSLGQPIRREHKISDELLSEFNVIPDLGVLGAHSLWSLLDETISYQGQKTLLKWICNDVFNIDILLQRQKTLQSLRFLRWFYTRLTITADPETLNHSGKQVKAILKKPFTENSFYKFLFMNLAAWIVFAGLLIARAVCGVHIPLYCFFVFPLMSWISLGQVAQVFNAGTGLSVHFESLGQVFAEIETELKRSKALQKVLPGIYKSQPSRDAKKLEFLLGLLGTQTNPLLHLLINAIVPWTYVAVYLLEKHKQKIAIYFLQAYEEMGELEVLGSLIIFDYYQTATYPVLSETHKLSFTNLMHPLLDRTKAVANSFELNESQSLGLLTGSNMAGKSTFLRTVGLNQILANMGAPVFAQAMQTTPMKIETCIEVSDSLRDGFSYFYAEVRKLKAILNYAGTHQPLLFLIDEIFKGTNNKERQIGSRSIIESLAKEKSAIGLISTHDLDLTNISNSEPRVTNLHFKETIGSDGKMHFTYQLNNGPCLTTNALIIMKAEGIYEGRIESQV